MASFKDLFFTPAEFANIAKVDRGSLSTLETNGRLKTIKRRIGNVDRKMISLEDMQDYFKNLRNPDFDRHGDQNQAEAFAPGAPKHKIQMFYNVKGGTGKS